MFHPDTQIELLLSLQRERTQRARERSLHQHRSPGPSRRERFLLVAGELLITWGTTLKSHATPDYCSEPSSPAVI